MIRLHALLLALYLFLGGLFPRADFSQLLRIGYAWEHFQEHREEAVLGGNSLSFWAFVEMHFFSDATHHHPGSDHHQDLPFQQLKHSYELLCPCTLVLSLPCIATLQTTPVCWKQWQPRVPVETIFHPPAC